MRPALTIILLLALALAASASFNSSAYLYASEGPADVQSETLDVGGGSTLYVLYTIGGIPSILTANDQPMTDPNAIASVLRDYQSHVLLPSPSELDALRSYILSFNSSRNVKTDAMARSYPSGIEDTCLIYTNLKYAPCSDATSCSATATMLCARYDVGTCPPDLISPMLLSYGRNVNTFANQTDSVLSALSDISLSNGAEQLASIQSSLSALQAAAQDQKVTKLRSTLASQCPDCLGICPTPALDTGSLDNASALASSLSARLAGAKPVQAMAIQITQSSADRLAYAQASALLVVWAPKWAQFKSKYGALKTQVDTLLTYNKDPNFTSSAAVFSQLWTSMESRMSNRNFNQVDADFARLGGLAAPLQAAATDAAVPYTQTRAAQNHASDALIQLRWRILPSDTSAVLAYNRLAARKTALDANFTPPFTSAQYSVFNQSYNSLISDAAAVHASESADPVSRLGQRFSEQSVNGAFSLAAAVVPLSASTRNQLAPAIPPVALLAADLAIASVVLVAFIGLLLYFRPLFRSRAMLGLWMALLFLLLFGLGLGSVGLYVVINHNAQSGTLADFERQIALSNSTYIAIDQSGAPAPALAAMTSCAQNISGQLSARWNKTTSVFSYAGKSCSWGSASNLTLTQCLDRVVQHPLFVLHYNATTSNPHFSTVYSSQADAYGTQDYYARCELGDVLN